MKFLITGADGLLGNNLVRELLANEHTVRVLLYPNSNARGLEELNIERKYGDITKDLEILNESVKDCDGVFHCAAITDLLADKEITYQVNVLGTKNIIDSCLKNRVKRLVFVGSASSFQYGSLTSPGSEKGGFSQTYKGICYMESKHAAMELVKDYVHEKKLDAVIVVPTFMLGAYDTRPSSGELIRQHIKNNLWFTTMGGRNFVHVRDVARAMLLAFEKGKSGETYILGNQNLSYFQFFKIVNHAIGRRSNQFRLPKLLIIFAGVCSQLIQKITRKKRLFNLQTAKLATLETYYTSHKAVSELGMPQTPIEIAINDSLNALKDYGYIV